MLIVPAVILGVVEGLTEFLPVSSTGHLMLVGAMLGYSDAQWATFNIVIQLGAILAVIVLYWRTLWDVLIGLFQREAGAYRFTRNVVIAFLPAAVIGLALHKKIEALLQRPDIVCVMLVLGGLAILAVELLVRRHRIEGVVNMPARTSVGVGFLQCLAMIPGVSRSAATILGARALGVERKTAAEFSFFLAIPTMLGATVVELGKNGAHLSPGGVGWGEIAIGFVTAFLVALIVVRAFVGFLGRHGFIPFAWYRIIIGIAGYWWLMGR